MRTNTVGTSASSNVSSSWHFGHDCYHLDRVLQFFLHILLNGFIQLRAGGPKHILRLQRSSFHKTPFFHYESFACIFLFAMPRNHIATERKMQETDVDGVGVGLNLSHFLYCRLMNNHGLIEVYRSIDLDLACITWFGHYATSQKKVAKRKSFCLLLFTSLRLIVCLMATVVVNLNSRLLVAWICVNFFVVLASLLLSFGDKSHDVHSSRVNEFQHSLAYYRVINLTQIGP